MKVDTFLDELGDILQEDFTYAVLWTKAELFKMLKLVLREFSQRTLIADKHVVRKVDGTTGESDLPEDFNQAYFSMFNQVQTDIIPFHELDFVDSDWVNDGTGTPSSSTIVGAGTDAVVKFVPVPSSVSTGVEGTTTSLGIKDTNDDVWDISLNNGVITTTIDTGATPADYSTGAIFRAPSGILDRGNTGHTLVESGGVTLNQSTKKFGDCSIEFDGTDDYIYTADHANWDVQANFSIDLWVKHTDHAGTETYLVQWEDGNNYWYFFHHHGSGLRFYIQSANVNIVEMPFGGEITDTNWHHLLMAKVGNDYGIYKDGTQVSFLNDASLDTFAGRLDIGAFNAGALFDGCMDEVRIYHGNPFNAVPVVGLTDTITRPTTYHTVDANTKLLIPAATKYQITLDTNGVLSSALSYDMSDYVYYLIADSIQETAYHLKVDANGVIDTMNYSCGTTVRIDINSVNQTMDQNYGIIVNAFVGAPASASVDSIHVAGPIGTTLHGLMSENSGYIWYKGLIQDPLTTESELFLSGGLRAIITHGILSRAFAKDGEGNDTQKAQLLKYIFELECEFVKNLFQRKK